MNPLGTYLSVLAGPTIPLPLPPVLNGRVRTVTVTESDEDVTAFTITLDAGRTGPLAALDTPMLTASTLRPNARVVLVLTMAGIPQVLVDGIITESELVPGTSDQGAELRLTGRDVSLLLDREEKSVSHPGTDDYTRVLKIVAGYAANGIVPSVVPPPTLDPSLPIERIPSQQATDWEYLGDLAYFHGYVCYLTPTPVPGTSTLYWGPPVRVGVPQPALSIDLGPATNVQGAVTYRNDVLGPERLDGQVVDPRLGKALPVRTVASLRPPLAVRPVWAEHAKDLRTRQFRDSGVSTMTAYARAQAAMDRSADCVTAAGTLDGSSYGRVLRPRGLVGMRGAGWSYDGLWYVKRVVHTINRGSYTAAFGLTREGVGSTLPIVPVF